MKTLLLCLAALIAVYLASRAAEPENPFVERQRFMPAQKTTEGRKAASFSALSKAPMVGKDELFAQVSAGIGDRFPVMEGKTKHFEVVLTDGNDDHLQVEVRTKDTTQKLD